MKNLTYFEEIVLNSIDLSSYEFEEPSAPLERVNKVYELFKEASEWLINEKKGNEQEAFTEWLKGVPNCLGVTYNYIDILKEAEVGGFNLMTTEAESNFIEMYYPNLTSAFFTLKNNL